MPIYHAHYTEYLTEFFRGAESEILIVTAFCTAEATRRVLNEVHASTGITLVTRWSRNDITSGASDLDVFDVIMERGGRMFRNDRLHAKIYMVDKHKYLFGSANLTGRGIGLSGIVSNIECLSFEEDVHTEDIALLNSIIRESQIVNHELVEEMRQQLEEHDANEWHEKKMEAVTQRPDGIFVNDLPFCRSPNYLVENPDSEEATHDRVIFGISDGPLTLDHLTTSFRRSCSVTWLDKAIHEEMNFGQLSHALHNSLLDDPRPYRKNVKILQSNLLEWVKALLPDSYELQVPPGRHSQVIRKL